MPIYLKIPGIKGEVTAKGHESWIEIGSMQWGVGRAIHTVTGGSKSRESSSPSVSEVSLTKLLDESTPKLFMEACVGESKDVQLDLVRTTGGELVTYLEYKLQNAVLSGFSCSSGGDRPSESLSINFTKIEMRYTPFDDKHQAGSPIPAGYDISLGKKV